MLRRNMILRGIVGMAVVLCALFFLEFSLVKMEPKDNIIEGDYHSLPEDISFEDPLLYLNDDFTPLKGFHTNLPIVVLELDDAPPDYKSFLCEQEIVDDTVEPWVGGVMRIIGIDSTEPQDNSLSDKAGYESRIRIKKRGHTSSLFDKSQYYIKAYLDDGVTENHAEILGMGEGHNWILNGSMADRSMLRNYLPYRICSEASGSAMSPDSRFCEAFIKAGDGELSYMGVFLIQETVSRGENRVNIDQFKKKNTYTSYIVRRDRQTSFDPMLDTYGRLNGYADTWIGLKYPSEKNVTPSVKAYVEEDFSKIERIIYSDNPNVFLAYGRYIDLDTFVDYFLLNEYFGNYDAGLHSTYMYKNTGGKLRIGPVWDFDQAENNYDMEEMNEMHIAFQTRTFYEQLVRDRRFVILLKKRYRELRGGALSDEHVAAVIEEASNYLRSAQKREWFRWAANYYSTDSNGGRNYVLKDYRKDGILVSRFNADYEQELRVLRIYLVNHAKYIQPALSDLLVDAKLDSSIGSYSWLLFIVFLLLMFGAMLISKRVD